MREILNITGTRVTSVKQAKPVIYFYISNANRWYTLHLIHSETGGYSAQGARNYPELVKQLLTYPIDRHATYEQIDKKQFLRLTKGNANATI